MSARFEELAWSQTLRGEISLRRRVEPTLKVDVYEVKLGEEFLMSSLFTVAEVGLARLGLARTPGTDLDVVVGGLGLGYTARAALEDPRVASMIVIDAMADVIEWHERELLPGATELVRDPRTRLVLDDFFGMAASDISSVWPHLTSVSTLTRRAAALTPYCWISTTRRVTCCIQATQRSTASTDYTR